MHFIELGVQPPRHDDLVDILETEAARQRQPLRQSGVVRGQIASAKAVQQLAGVQRESLRAPEPADPAGRDGLCRPISTESKIIGTFRLFANATKSSASQQFTIGCTPKMRAVSSLTQGATVAEVMRQCGWGPLHKNAV